MNGRLCLIYSLDQNWDAEQRMTCRHIFSSSRLRDLLPLNHRLPPQNLPCKFHLHFISCDSHCVPLSRMPDRYASLQDVEACFPPCTHHDPSPAHSGGGRVAPPSPHDGEEPPPLVANHAPRQRKTTDIKSTATQHCCHQFGRPPMPLTLWEKYAGLNAGLKQG